MLFWLRLNVAIATRQTLEKDWLGKAKKRDPRVGWIGSFFTRVKRICYNAREAINEAILSCEWPAGRVTMASAIIYQSIKTLNTDDSQQYQDATSSEGKMIHSDNDFFCFNRFITWPGVFVRKSDVWIVREWSWTTYQWKHSRLDVNCKHCLKAIK